MSHTMTTQSRGIEVSCDCQHGRDHDEVFYDVPVLVGADGDDITGAEVLATPMGPNEADARTIREYLSALLRALWAEREGFSGKRPFGNSGWTYEPTEALFQAGLLSGDHPEPGYGHTPQQRERGDRLIRLAIDALGSETTDERVAS